MARDEPLPILFYRTQTSREPVREWLKELPREEKKQIGEDIKTVQFCWPMGMPLVRPLEKGLWEVRIKLRNRIARVLFTEQEGCLILLHGFIKKSQKTPKQDMDLARKRLAELQGDRK